MILLIRLSSPLTTALLPLLLVSFTGFQILFTREFPSASESRGDVGGFLASSTLSDQTFWWILVSEFRKFPETCPVSTLQSRRRWKGEMRKDLNAPRLYGFLNQRSALSVTRLCEKIASYPSLHSSSHQVIDCSQRVITVTDSFTTASSSPAPPPPSLPLIRFQTAVREEELVIFYSRRSEGMSSSASERLSHF